MGSGAENIYPVPPPVVLPLGEAAPRTPGAGPGRPRGGGAAAPGPRPGLSAEQTDWGGSLLPLTSALGRGGAAPKLGGLGGGGGAVPQRTPRPISPIQRHGSGRTGPGAAPRLPPASGAGGTSPLPAWDTRSREWDDGEAIGAR